MLGVGLGGLVMVFCVVYYGVKVVLFDLVLFGGICVYCGCVLKKVLWYVV